MTTINKITPEGLELIKSFESCSLEVYHGKDDPADVFTIGYGHTAGVTRDSPPITQAQADNYLQQDLSAACFDVENAIYAELNDNQYSALVSLVDNAGATTVQGTLGKLLNSNDYEGASEFFLRWDKVHIDGVLTVSQGLLNRRIAERALFDKPVEAA